MISNTQKDFTGSIVNVTPFYMRNLASQIGDSGLGGPRY
jgi:hypothetical protein